MPRKTYIVKIMLSAKQGAPRNAENEYVH